MKKIINGKMYNTETAREVACWWNNMTGFDLVYKTLYIKRTGEFFMYCEGGARTKYSVRCGDNTWTGGSKIVPVTEDFAKSWLCNNDFDDEYIELFGEPEEQKGEQYGEVLQCCSRIDT